MSATDVAVSPGRHLSRRTVLLGLGVSAWALGPRPARARDDVVGTLAGTQIRFASVAQARALLAADDEWMRATSEFQRRAVMGRAEPVTAEAFRRWNADAAQPWQPAARERWTRAWEVLAPAWTALRIPQPPQVLLVASNGQESAGAPYTRGNGVMLMPSLDTHATGDAGLLAHELWHVASRHDPALATRLYRLLGFEPMPPLAFPEAWAAVRIANPDAPDNRHALRMTVDGRPRLVTPVLVADRTALQPGETFFHVMDVRLLEVQPAADGAMSTAVVHNGQPVWHAVRSSPDYLRQLGGNTGYVIHPEETIADNIALLATGRAARNPALLARIEAVLKAS